MSKQKSILMMGGGPSATPSTNPKGTGGGGGYLWYVICREGIVKIVNEGEIGNGKELTNPFETKKEAIEWAANNYPDKKC